MIESAQLLQAFDDIFEFQWLIEIILLSLFISLSKKDKTANSNAIALVVFALVGSIAYRYGLVVYQSDPDITLTPLQLWFKNNNQVMMFAWYIGFWLFDFIGMLAIYLLHQRFKLPNGYVTKTILLAYLTSALLNAFTFAERLLWDTRFFYQLYQWVLPSINIGVLMVIFAATAKTTYDYILERKSTK